MKADPARLGIRIVTPVEESILGVPWSQAPTLIPGLAAAALLAWASTWLSDWLGVSVLHFSKTPISPAMMAILLGLLIGNPIRLPSILQPGLVFAVKKMLRLGIILLGLRLSLVDVLKLGTLGVPIVLLCIGSALLITVLLNRKFNLPEQLGLLIAVGTSICGVTAIVAAGPSIKAKDEQIAYAVAVITLFGMVATLVYPYLAAALFGTNAVLAGLFLGTSIHDTSQVTAAALVFSDVYSLPRALDVATVTKLVRNVFIAFVIPFIAYRYHAGAEARGEGASKLNIAKLLPLFVLGFLALAALRSVGDLGLGSGGLALGIWDAAAWKGLTGVLQDWAVNFLTVALAGVGLTTRFRTLRGMGIKPFLVGLAAAIAVGVVSWAAVSVLGQFVVGLK